MQLTPMHAGEVPDNLLILLYSDLRIREDNFDIRSMADNLTERSGRNLPGN